MNDKSKNILEIESNEHVLSYYADNRIKLMQEVLSLIKPKKIMTMAPDFMKSMQLSVVKSLLLEELLGISNKRLRNILAGENVDVDTSSSSESEIELNKGADLDTLSLQEISDDSDCCIDIQLSEQERLELEKDNANLVIKTEPKRGEKRKDTGKHRKRKTSAKKMPKTEQEPVVNVLNLLELQARARAIRSQLANEMLLDKDIKIDVPSPTNKEVHLNTSTNDNDSDKDGSTNSVVCISPDNLSVVSVASNSDSEKNQNIEDVENTEDKSVTSDNTKNHSETVSENSEKHDVPAEKDESNTEEWKTRWLESKKVQDVMKTTKLYSNMRQSRLQKNISSEETTVESNHPEINHDLADKDKSSEPNENNHPTEEPTK